MIYYICCMQFLPDRSLNYFFDNANIHLFFTSRGGDINPITYNNIISYTNTLWQKDRRPRCWAEIHPARSARSCSTAMSNHQKWVLLNLYSTVCAGNIKQMNYFYRSRSGEDVIVQPSKQDSDQPEGESTNDSTTVCFIQRNVIIFKKYMKK